MKRSHISRLLFLVGLSVAVLPASVFCQRTGAQDDTGSRLANSRYVPDEALAAVLASPADWLENPTLEMFPIEIMRVQMQENLGVDPMDIGEVRVVVALDPQTMQPQVGSLTRLRGEINFQKLHEAVNASPDAVQVNGHETYPINGPPGAVISMIDDETLFMGTANYLQPMLDAENGTGELPSLLDTMPEQSGLAFAMVMAPIRPMLSGVARQGAQNLAPNLQPLAQIPDLTDAIKIQIDFSQDVGSLRVALVGTDEVAAQRIESILRDSIVAARVLGIAEMERSMATSDQSEAMQEATSKYANRIADMVTAQLQPKLRGDEVSLEVESGISIATTGVLVGLLLPAVQAARQAARRMSASNNLKQVMLALHNYHDSYRHFPTPAITDDEGNPLLSWRVAILPFVEEVELYQKFHLDEPWDSEHNLPLSKELPAVYATPDTPLAPGKTIVQAVVGETIGLHPQKATRFRDILDGTSNSILIMEVNPDQAVVWSKPADLEIDLENPMAHLGNVRNGGFHVGFGDGMVQFISGNIDPERFEKFLTRAGGEVVDRLD